ncbi:MAG: dnaE2 1 [Planctomycetaceae bacterium]|nr:dnaE2 1 [Planctomycetaceae bacterium]
MPDPPFPKARSPLAVSTNVRHASEPYAELRCRTNYSFLEGASHPDELVVRAAELGLSALAITDRNSLAGVVRAHVAAKQVGLKLLIGTEVIPQEHSTAVLLTTDRAAYGRLCQLLTRGRQQAPKGECALTFTDIANHAAGVLACVVLDPAASDRQITELPKWREVFGDRCYALAELHRGPRDEALLKQFQRQARQAGLPLVAANGVYYHVPERRQLHDVVTAIRHGCTVAELGARRFPNGERHLKSAAEMQDLFAEYPEAVLRTIEIADRCSFSLDELKYEYPDEIYSTTETPIDYLARLTWEGADNRYPNGVPAKIQETIHKELQLISELNYAAYFLTVYDLVKFARGKNILCQGRGSAANSAVCYCLEVTSVDPAIHQLLFERFISKERAEAPDIDIDFEHERREEVIQYIYQKYGRDRAGMTAEVITYRSRSAVRDVGKALGLSLDRVDALAKSLDHSRESVQIAQRFQEAGFDSTSPIATHLIKLVREILGFPRHLSQHVGGMVITQGPLCELVPIENASMPGRTVVEWDKDDLDALGILKVDCLALGMLTAIRKCFEMVKNHAHRDLTLANIPPDDAAVYGMMCKADTIGVFQIESRAQMSMLPRLKPNKFYDLVIEVAIVRPGPIQGDMVHPYLRRRAGDEAVTYPSPEVESVLSRTMGVPIFQEQAMKLVIVAAGFTAGEADQFRRAMGAWRKTGEIEKFHLKLTQGMQRKGYTPEFSEQLFNQIRGFGEYGFPESHAASFALLVYVSAWLKHYYPAAFTASLVNSQPMGFYAPSQLISDARRHGVDVHPVDINASDWDCTLEETKQNGVVSWAIRLGWRMLRGISQSTAESLVTCRRSKRFTSYDEFVQRTQFSPTILALLSDADAFRSLHESRRTAFWKSLPAQDSTELFEDEVNPEPLAPLPVMTSQQQVIADYRSTGLSLRQHPMSFIRGELAQRRVIRSDELLRVDPDRRYRVAGLVLLRQRPGTAKGITFMTIEDEAGTANLIVRTDVWERFHQIARQATALIVHGILQRKDGIAHVLVDQMEDLSQLLAEVGNKSRDFR